MLRGKSNTLAIFALNFFLGWSFIGWIISLVWSLSSDNKTQTIIVNNHVSAERTINPIVTQPVQENFSNNQALPKQQVQLESTIVKSHQDKISQLQQLKQLLDAGILTQEEFNNQKSQILAP